MTLCSIGEHRIDVSREQKGGMKPHVVCGGTINSLAFLEYKVQGGRWEVVCSANADRALSLCRHCVWCWGVYSRELGASKELELELSNILLPWTSLVAQW